ncbi:MAG: hypothetical protein JO086_02130 [Acidimicrobiia bacterium]|nr:hypothetical protein [Acidimicrobiia bacterium]
MLGPAILCSGSTSRPLARLAALDGRLDDARRLFEDAMTLNAAMGARPWVAHTQHEYAQVLLASGNDGHRERAAELLAAARQTAEDLGMAALLGDLKQLA